MIRSSRPYLSRRAVAALILGVAAALGACATDVPTVSGFGLGNGRIVGLGEMIKIRMPIHDDGAQQWRVSSYDSLYLTLADTPRVVQAEGGGTELLVRARARTLGETQIELIEVASRGRRARVMRFDVSIVE